METVKCILMIAMTILAGCSADSRKRDAIMASGTVQATVDADAALKTALATLGTVQVSAIFAADSSVPDLIQQTTVALANAYAKLVIASAELNKAIALLNGTTQAQLQSCKASLDDAASKIQTSLSTLVNVTTAAAFKSALSAILTVVSTCSGSVSNISLQLVGLKIQLQAALDANVVLNIDLSDVSAITNVNVSIDLSAVINIAKQVLAALEDFLQLLGPSLSSLTAQTFTAFKSQLIAALNALLTNVAALIAAAKSALQQASANIQLRAFLGAVISTCEGVSLQINAFINLVQTTTSPATLKLILNGFGSTLTATIQGAVNAVANAIAKLTVAVQTTGSSVIIQAAVDAAATLQAALTALANIKTQAAAATDATVTALIQQTITILSNIYVKLTLASSNLAVGIATVTGSVQTQLQTCKTSIDTIASNINGLLSSLASTTTAANFNSAINNTVNACNSASANLNTVKDQLVNLKAQLDAALQAAAQFDLSDLTAVGNINVSTSITVLVNAAKDIQLSLSNLGTLIATIASSLGSASTFTFQTLKTQLTAAVNDFLTKLNALSSAATSLSTNANAQLKVFLAAIISTCEGIKVQTNAFIALVQGTATPSNLKLILDGISGSIFVAIKTAVTVVVNAVIKLSGGTAPIGSSVIIQATVDAAAALQTAIATLATIKTQATTATDATVTSLIQQTTTLILNIYIKLAIASSKLSEAIAIVNGTLKTQLQSIKSSIGTIIANINPLLTSLGNVIPTAAAFNPVINTILTSCTAASASLNTVKDQLIGLQVQLAAALDTAFLFDLTDLFAIANISSLPDLTALVGAKENLQASFSDLVNITTTITTALTSSLDQSTFQALKAQLTDALNDLFGKLGDLATATTNVLASASANIQLTALLTAIISACEGIKVQVTAFITLIQSTATPANLKTIFDGISTTIYAAIKGTLTIVINALSKLGGTITGGSSSLIQAFITTAAAIQTGIGALGSIATQAQTASDSAVPALVQQSISIVLSISVKITAVLSKLSEAIAIAGNGTTSDQLIEIKAYISGIATSISNALTSLTNVTSITAFKASIANVVSTCNSASATFNTVKNVIINVKAQLDEALGVEFDLADLPSLSNITSSSIDLTALVNAAQNLKVSLSSLDNFTTTAAASLATATTATFQSINAQLTAASNALLTAVNTVASAAKNASAGANVQLTAFLTVIVSTCEGIKVKIVAFITLVQGTNAPAILKLILDGISSNLYSAIKSAVTVVVNAILKIGGEIANNGYSDVIQATVDAAATLQTALSVLATIKTQASTATDATITTIIQNTITLLTNIYVKLTSASSKLSEAIAKLTGSIQAQLKTFKNSIDTIASSINGLLTSLASVTTAAGFNAAISNIVTVCTSASATLNPLKDQLISLKVQLDTALQAAVKFDLTDLLAIANISPANDVTVLVNAGKSLQTSLANLGSIITTLSSSLGSATTATFQSLKTQLTTALNDLLTKLNDLATAATSALASASTNVQLKAFLTIIISTCEGIKVQINAFISLVQGTATPATLKLILDGITISLYASLKSAVTVVANAVVQLGGGIQTISANSIVQVVIDANTALQLAVTAIATIKANATAATDATVSAAIQQTVKILVNVYIKLIFAIATVGDATVLVSGSVQGQLQAVKSSCQAASVQILASLYSLTTITTASAFQAAINTISTVVVSVSTSLSSAKDTMLALKAQLDAAIQASLIFDLSDLTIVAQVPITSDITVLINAANSLSSSLQNINTVVSQVTASLSTATNQTVLSLKVQVSNAFNSFVAACNAVIAGLNALLAKATNTQLKAYLNAAISTCNDILIQANAGINIINVDMTPASFAVILNEISASLLVANKNLVNLVVKAILELRPPTGGIQGIIKFVLKLFGYSCD